MTDRFAELPSQLVPWDPAPVRALTGFAREAIRERARLALADPAGEHEATRPLSGARARWILLTLDADDRAARSSRASSSPSWSTSSWSSASKPSRIDDADLLARLGADPNRTRGRVPCPAHGGKDRNLDWRRADDGRVLVHCFSHGCTFTEILAAVR